MNAEFWLRNAYETLNFAKRTSYVLDDPEALYVVMEGTCEVYTAPIRDGCAASMKTFLFVVGAEQCMFAFPDKQDGRFGLIADAFAGTKLLKVALHTLLSRLREDDELRLGIARRIDEWLQNIATSVVTQIPPRNAHPVTVEEETIVWKEGEFISENGVIWTKPTTLAVQCWGRHDLPEISVNQFVPLMRSVWFTSPKGNRLQHICTALFMKEDEFGTSLRLYHHLIRLFIQRDAKDREEMDRTRMGLRSQQDHLMMTQALSRFSAVAEKNGQEKLLAESEGDEPLLRCCRWIGKELGIDIKTQRQVNELRRKLRAEDIFLDSGVRYRKVALRDGWWREDNGPLLAFWADGWPVALFPDNGPSYHFRDGVNGEKGKMNAELAAQMGAFAYELYRPLPNRVLNTKDLMRFMFVSRTKKDGYRALLFGLVTGLLGMAFPIITGMLVDKIIPAAEPEQLFYMLVLLAAVSFAIFACNVSQSFLWLRLFGTSDAALQSATWDRLLNMPVTFFRKYNAGDLAERISGVSASFRLFADWISTGMSNALFSIVQIMLLLWYQSRLAWLAVGLTAIYVLLFALISVKLRKYTHKTAEQEGAVSGLLIQLVANIPKLRVAAAERRAFNRWSSAFSIQRSFAYKLRETGNHLQIINSGYPLLSSLVLFWAVSAFGIQMNPGEFVAFYTAYSILIGSVIGFCACSLPLFELLPLYQRIKPLLEEQPETEVSRAEPGVLRGEIEISHVSFAYHAPSGLTLDDVSLQVRAGEYIAIVGSSGSGKSTLLRLLLGFEMPVAGAIYYDGKDLNGLDLKAVRRQCGVVLQNGRVWSGDILQNIIGQSGDLTLNDAWDAAEAVGLDRDINQLPMGMHTVLSEDGGTFSGGQRQRILIARAIVHKPKIVLLDEATSALDQISQEKVTEMLKNMNATRIVIAHRLSTIVHADRIIVMDKGKIVQQGTYEELLAQEGLFARMARRQVV
ncbi:NHLP bacteriocin export ABC transporter permease/ATPase subunit [Aneurinibacillus migulanus]|uniref:NHLP bacteriocin export ABC transporter permease/ATPase subunit n=1 Tax=Aneurinibacillus migulanus TaxID=47500 RepID=UPI00209DE4C3|nr:NHLP bacteriocin export ABC transporter permease/ATPase subunit [Aneurinibacillus migulanus]MCP1358502.1 NHLP bacteriocin export ABC transporter permease/ATPase subunit [Aneurinibacillus migulanus]